MRTRLARFLLLTGLLLGPASVRAAEGEAGRVQQLKRDVQDVEARLLLVERQYVQRRDPSEEEALRQRYSDAELQFLLNNHAAASVLLYDLLGSPSFRNGAQYTEALYMLAEALYQQQNFLGARLYFREHMNRRGSHYRDALGRYLEISGRINEFAGIDQYIEEAKGPGGSLPTDVAYIYAKWLFRRTDLPPAERAQRAERAFSDVVAAQGAYAAQATYFLGVLALQQGKLERAAELFEAALKTPARDERDAKVHELANLSLGRIYFEQGDYDRAVDRYQEIDYRSDQFPEALYEIAWAHVRRAKKHGPAEYQKASHACDKLLIAAADSVLAPEARILQGHLLLKLGKYQEANDAYTSIINTYLQIYDDIDGRLKAHPDPVQYFQKTIDASGKTFDIAAFLPPLAVKWATTQHEVAEAVQVTADIDSSKKGVVESNEIAARLLEVLDKREMELFPQFQEGYNRAEAADSALARVESELLQVEQAVVGPSRLAGILQELEAVRAERAGLEGKFRSLPKTEVEVDARRQRMAESVREVEQQAFRLGYQVESLYAVLAALEKFVADTRDQRANDPAEEREFAERMQKEREVAAQLREELLAVQKAVRDEAARVALLGGGDAELRARYEGLMQREKALLQSARAGLPAADLEVLGGIDATREQIGRLKARSATAKEKIRLAVRQKGEAIREKVRTEARLLKDYEAEVALVSGKAQNLVGSIAYESFKRVRKQFYELVLKADVGLVDVAWTRKQDKTNQIQGLAQQKDREMKALDDEFKEVLKDVE